MNCKICGKPISEANALAEHSGCGVQWLLTDGIKGFGCDHTVQCQCPKCGVTCPCPFTSAERTAAMERQKP
jgi:hypothetical protein